MIVSFALKNQIIRRTDYNIVVAQSKNYLRARFDALSDDWIGPITAIFNDYVVVLDENNECLVPWEVLQNPGVVSVSAFCGDLHTASVATMVVKPSGYVDGETPEPPTPGVYVQLTGLVQNAVDTANSVQQRADAGEFDGKDGKNGADGYSPVATVQQTADGATITITDKTGTSTATVKNGQNGTDGKDGADGFSPVANAQQTDNGAIITITDKTGTTAVTVRNGKDGVNGQDGKPGPQGAQGPQGEQGKQGEPGPQGPDGKDAPQIDDTQASQTNPWSGAKTDAELLKKLDANQGAENAGKFLGIDEEGNIVPVAGGLETDFVLIGSVDLSEPVKTVSVQLSDIANSLVVHIETPSRTASGVSIRVGSYQIGYILSTVFPAARTLITRIDAYNDFVLCDTRCGSNINALNITSASIAYIDVKDGFSEILFTSAEDFITGTTFKIYGRVV